MDNTSFAPGNNSINNSVPPPTPQYSEPEHKHFLNKKFIVTFVILALLGGGAYGGVWYWQDQQVVNEIVPTFTPRVDGSTSLTTSWKTYTNTQYGFEVKYPESYSMSGTSNGSNITFKSTEACKSFVSGGGEWPIDCQSYNILVQQNKISGPEMSKTFVAGIQAEKYSDSNGQWSNGTQILVQFQKGQNWYIQTFTFNTAKSQISESIMDQILSTFKFIDSADTSTWKTYSGSTVYGEQYKYSVKYPSVWQLGKGRGDATLEYGQCTISLGAGGGGAPGTQIETHKINIGGVAGDQTIYEEQTNGITYRFVYTWFGSQYGFELIYPKQDSTCLTDYKNILETLKIN